MPFCNDIPSSPSFFWYPHPGCLEAYDTIDARAAEYQAAEKAAAGAHLAKEKAEEEVKAVWKLWNSWNSEFSLFRVMERDVKLGNERWKVHFELDFFRYSLLTLELWAGQETNQRKEGRGETSHSSVILETFQDHVPLEYECVGGRWHLKSERISFSKPMKLFKTFQKHIFLFLNMFLFFFSLETLFKSEDGKNQEAKAAAAAKASKVGISKSWNIGETKLKRSEKPRTSGWLTLITFIARGWIPLVTILVHILATCLTKEPDNFEERLTFDTGAIASGQAKRRRRRKA